jgi:uridylate kinase
MKRILLKLSGEALAGEKGTGFDESVCFEVAAQVKKVIDAGTQTAIVIGGGNFWRGRSSQDMDRSSADSIGMLATVMNAIYVSDVFRRAGMKTSVMTPFACGSFTELYDKDAAVDALDEGKVVFFAGGTGHPYFSTDTGAVLRALEIGADAMLLAKNIDGVYDADPEKDQDAKKYDSVTIDEVIDKNLQVIDMTASIMCRDNGLPMKIFALREEDSILRTVQGENTGTTVTV